MKNEPPEAGTWKTLKSLGGYLWLADRWDLRIRFLMALFLLACSKLLNVYVPFLLKDAIDSMSGTGVLILPAAVIFAYGSARVTVQLFGELRDFIFANVIQNAIRMIALRTFKHLHSLSLEFHLARQTGGLTRVIERGTRAIQFVLNFMTFNVVPTLFEIALVTAIMVYKFNWVFAAVIFFTIAGYIFLTLAVTEWRLKFRREMNDQESKANSKVVDSLLNFETVKYFGNEDHEYSRYDHNLARYEFAAVQSQSSLSLLNVLQGAVIGLGLVIIMTLAGKGVVAGTMTVGDFVMVNAFLIQLYLPLGFLGFVYREIKQGLIDMDKMFELIGVSSSVSDAPDAKPLVVDTASVEFEGVCFSYNKDREILKNISFTVHPGETVAIVGPSGSGKSTLSRLLFRFYDINAGRIKIDGSDIRTVTQSSLRDAIGVVPQDTVLFNDTIGYNILYGKPAASMETMHSAAKHAKIDAFIDGLPKKYETEVGERGLKLSGGEKQRVAIARTILKESKILVFDEATSALDSHTEKEIQASLREVSENRTTMVIAHRLSTIVDADQILVLKGGEIVERGRHAELLARNGEYSGMWAKQQEDSAEAS